jgi:hypothetical protein
MRVIRVRDLGLAAHDLLGGVERDNWEPSEIPDVLADGELGELDTDDLQRASTVAIVPAIAPAEVRPPVIPLALGGSARRIR